MRHNRDRCGCAKYQPDVPIKKGVVYFNAVWKEHFILKGAFLFEIGNPSAFKIALTQQRIESL